MTPCAQYLWISYWGFDINAFFLPHLWLHQYHVWSQLSVSSDSLITQMSIWFQRFTFILHILHSSLGFVQVFAVFMLPHEKAIDCRLHILMHILKDIKISQEIWIIQKKDQFQSEIYLFLPNPTCIHAVTFKSNDSSKRFTTCHIHTHIHT